MGCEGCYYYRFIGYGNPMKVCHYLLDGNGARSLICPRGDQCTVRVERKETRRPPIHKYDTAG